MIPELQLHQKSTIEHICLARLICHVGVLLSFENAPKLLLPLTDIYCNPVNLSNTYFPTMPDDHLLAARGAINESGSWYQCPNGDPYFIGEVGTN